MSKGIWIDDFLLTIFDWRFTIYFESASAMLVLLPQRGLGLNGFEALRFVFFIADFVPSTAKPTTRQVFCGIGGGEAGEGPVGDCIAVGFLISF